MMLVQEAKAANVIGRVVSQDFGIEDEAMIMGFLQNNIYSNKPKAICQEYMCNARDAHIEIGTPDKPIRVKLPTNLDPTWECQDFGKGINPDRIAKIFVKYGASTKRGSNNETGGFGIGAKTGFSYSDSFIIRTISNENGVNVCRTYVAIKVGDNGKPSLKEIGNPQETQDVTGTTIVITVDPKDFHYFNEYTIRVTQFWKVRPEIIGDAGIAWEEYKWQYEQPEWKLGNEKGYYDAVHACVDGVPYPITINEFSHLSDNLQNILKHNCVMFFKVGELSLSLSREQLDYTKRTKDAITKRLEEIQAFIELEVTDKIANASNLWEANMLYNKLNAMFRVSKFAASVKWNGFDVDGDPLHTTQGVDLRVYEPDYMTNLRSRKTYDVKPKENVIVAINDLGTSRPDHRRIKTIDKNNPGSKIYCINPIDAPSFDAWKIKVNYDDIKGGFVMLSTVQPTKYVRATTGNTGRGRRPKGCMTGVKKWDEASLNFIDVDDVNVDDEGYFYDIGWKGRINNCNIMYLRELTTKGLIKDQPIYAIPSRYSDNNKLGDGWNYASDLLKDIFNTWKKDNPQAVAEFDAGKPETKYTCDNTFSQKLGTIMMQNKDQFDNKTLRDWIKKSNEANAASVDSQQVKDYVHIATICGQTIERGIVKSEELKTLRNKLFDEKLLDFINSAFDDTYFDGSYNSNYHPKTWEKVVKCINALIPA